MTGDAWRVTTASLAQLLRVAGPSMSPALSHQAEVCTNGVYRAKPTCGTLAHILALYTPMIPTKKKNFLWKKDADLVEQYQPSASQYMTNRRLKMSSVLKYYDTDFHQYLTGLTYQTALNVLIWSTALTPREKQQVLGSGLFSAQSTFIEFASKISQHVKPYSAETREKKLLGELHVLEGYRHHDDSWVLHDEMAKLAGTYPERTTDWWAAWSESADSVIDRKDPLPTWVSFEEYTKSLSWATTGSCSIGTVYYKNGDKVQHFKPRKNMVTALFTPDEIWDIVSKWDGTIKNYPVVKNELGKIRLAIASNFESYIWESYCLEMLGHCFKNWAGITLDESVTAEIRRNNEDMEALRDGAVALPWDFASFDHQVRQEEILDILTRLKLCSDPRTHIQWDKVLQSYTKATLSDPATGTTYPVVHGLQSGQRTTSLIGNVWNAIVTRIAITRTKQILGRDPHFRVGIRGDDTYVLANSVADLYVLRLAYASYLIIGHDKKFSIRYASFEFLRNSVYGNAITGWPCRAIPAITERKPWSDDLLRPAEEVITIGENIRNLERRLTMEIPTLHQSNMFQWSKFTGLSYNWLRLPRRLGGFGLYDFGGLVPDGKISLTPELDYEVTNKFSTYAPSYLGLNAEQSEAFNRARFKAMVKPSDMRNLLSDIMSQFRSMRDKARKAKIRWSRKNIPYDIRVETTPRIQLTTLASDYFKVNLQAATDGWPRFPKLLSDYPSYRAALGKEAPSLGKLIKQHYPDVCAIIKRIEAKGWHRADAIDAVLGHLPSESTYPLNSKTRVLALAHLTGDWLTPPSGYRDRSRIGYYAYAMTRTAVLAFTNTRLALQFLY
ncbi:MAG: RNA-dependent RNA polymerase [Hangzhou totivirus 8]|nr:MAG: RNA-dependent RNA polymerase [Hangzhou totivirus 8]